MVSGYDAPFDRDPTTLFASRFIGGGFHLFIEFLQGILQRRDPVLHRMELSGQAAIIVHRQPIRILHAIPGEVLLPCGKPILQ